MEVRGTTVEERQEARRRRTAERRAVHYRGLLLAAAGSPSSQLRLACDYLRAIGDDLPPAEVTALARETAELADDWSAK